jgi:predicted lipoprotein with Yx(FWY)xxD motif
VKWPPYLVTDNETKNLPADQGVITRADGKKQLTYDQKPLYTFFQDRTPNDAKGEGLGGVWHVISE